MFNNVFLFPGQGSQYVGMGKSFYDNSSLARKRFKQADKVLGFDFTKLCFEGPYSELSKAENIQPAVLLISVIAFEAWMKKIEIPPRFLIGHSFGELSALACSGAIDFEDAIRIARLKGKIAVALVQDKSVAMSVIKNINQKDLEKICEKVSSKEEFASIGVINSNNQITITGYKDAIEKVHSIVNKKGGEYQKINTDAPFHSSVLREGVNKLKKELNKIKINSFKYPVFSSTRLSFYKNSKDVVDIISNSYIEMVDWIKTMEFLKKENIDTTVELGPQKILTNIVSENYKDFWPYSFSKYGDIDFLLEKFNLSGDKKYNIVSKCLKIAVCLKNNNENELDYEKKVIKSYNKVFKEFAVSKDKKIELSLNQVIEALNMLDLIMKIKKVDSDEVNERWKEVFGGVKINNNYGQEI
ncbi:ACP S-malonyltransferase [bacterium]|nr:ACP S-malonyltransferase [bacterium]